MFVDYLDNIDELENNNEVKKNINIIEQIYKFMSFVNFLSFESTSLANSDMNWNYKGDGVVKINVIRNKIADIIDEEWTDKIEIYMKYFKGRDDIYPYLSIDKNNPSKKYYENIMYSYTIVKSL